MSEAFPFITIPCPNVEPRVNGVAPQFIVIHYTDTVDFDETCAILQDPQKKVSSHVVIDVDGKVYRLVDDNKTAWHAGLSYWRGVRNINHHALGVELQNGGVRYPDNHGKLSDFPPKQIAALINLLQYWQKKFSITAPNIIGHSDVSPGRKIDPGAKFPWPSLVAKNLAQDMNPHRAILTMPDDDARQALLALGYDPQVDTAILRQAFALRLGIDPA